MGYYSPPIYGVRLWRFSRSPPSRLLRYARNPPRSCIFPPYSNLLNLVWTFRRGTGPIYVTSPCAAQRKKRGRERLGGQAAWGGRARYISWGQGGPVYFRKVHVGAGHIFQVSGSQCEKQPGITW